jgi:hypothetical protein
MLDKETRDLLDVAAFYGGGALTVSALEGTIYEERANQQRRLDELGTIRERNDVLQSALAQEIARLRALSEELREQREASGIGAGLRGWFNKIMGRSADRRSIEDLLRRQYELSARRLKEASEFADRLTAAKADLFDEIERLHGKILQYARYARSAAGALMRLSEAKTALEGRLDLVEPGSLEAREIEAALDQLRRGMTEHSALLKLFGTADGRLAKLQENTRLLAGTIGQLQSDITMYVTAASEKLDLLSGQIQAIGAAADASMVMLELKESLDALTESVNHTTRFVSETQVYFRDNVDRMVEELTLYDAETEALLSQNTALNEVYDDMQISEAIALAMAQRVEQEAAGAAAPAASGVVLSFESGAAAGAASGAGQGVMRGQEQKR